MSRFSALTRMRFRCDRAEEAWQELLGLVREAASQPGYGGPPIAEVERVLEHITGVRASIIAWRAAAAPKRVKPAAPASPAEMHQRAQKILRSARSKRAMAGIDAILAAAGGFPLSRD